MSKHQPAQLKIGLKSFLSMVAILGSIMLLVGILTYIIPAGTYEIGPNNEIIPGTYQVITSTTRLPIWRWLTAPFESLFLANGSATVMQIIVLLLFLGGSLAIIEDIGGIESLVRVLVRKLAHKRYRALWIITFVMMLLSSLLGLQEELLILLPIFLVFAKAMGWSRMMALSLVLITTGVGFTAAMLNPFTIGIVSQLAGIRVTDGLWYRAIIFVVLYFLAVLFLIRLAKWEEKNLVKDTGVVDSIHQEVDSHHHDNRNVRNLIILFSFVIIVMIAAAVVPVLADLGIGMVLMALSFVFGTFIIGIRANGIKKTWKQFIRGVKMISPSIVIVLMAFSIIYIAEKGDILHTAFHYIYGILTSQSPYISVMIIYFFTLIVEFFIPSSTSKSLLIIPLLTLAPIPGISKNIIALAYLFGDGYTNILYPTCGTLIIGLGLAEVGYLQWVKKTWKFQVALFFISSIFLLIAVWIGL